MIPFFVGKVSDERRNWLQSTGAAIKDWFLDTFTDKENGSQDVSEALARVSNPEIAREQAMAQLYEDNPEAFAAMQQQEFEQASAREAMKFNAEQAQINRDWQTNANKIAMDFEASEAQKNRDWIDQQRATAYQVAMSDMKAAGLNPILAASNGGAATVGGSVASGFSSSGSSASGVAASGSKANTDYVGKREFAQSLVSAASQIGMSVLLRRSFGK